MRAILKKIIYLSGLGTCLILNNGTFARWANKDDEAAFVAKYHVAYKIRNDGTYTKRVDQAVEIVREDARMTEGLVRFKYKPDSETLRILEAYTQNGDKREAVPTESIEDKPLASNGEGFDQTNQTTLVFPDVKVGSVLHYVFEREYKIVQIPDFFSEYLFFGGDYFKDIEVRIDSDLPLFADLNDPTKLLKLKLSKHSLTLKSRGPLHRRVIDETDTIFNPSSHPWLFVSTANHWREFAATIIDEYEKILTEPIPKVFTHIIRQAQKEKDPEVQMNIVTSEIANHLRYHGDWRSVRGRNIPRPLSLVAKTRFGDCKDFAAITTALLRAIGIRADMAWVTRSVEPDFTPKKFPHTLFNHAICRAEVKGKVYWLDATNTASFAQGIFEDIIDRPAFVLDKGAARLEEIPPGTPANSAIEEFQDISFGNRPHVSGKIRFSGREASSEAGLARESSPESLRHHLIDFISRDVPIGNWLLSSLDLSDRVTKDFEVAFEFSPKLSAITTSAGSGFKVPTPRRIGGLFEVRTDRVSDYFIAQPVTLISEIHLSNVKIVGSEDLSCKIESPWVSAIRTFAKTSNGATILDRILVQRATLSPKEIESREFVEFQQRLIACFRSNILIFNQK
jgi:hypothetical protein